MKKLFLYIFVIIVSSCETERVIFSGPYFVRFTEAAQSEKESYSKPFDIEVHNAGPALEEDIIINYKISGSAREGIDYVILSEPEKVIITKGGYVGNIKFKLINNANNILRSQDIVFTLQTVNTEKLQVGQGASYIGKIFTFTIVDDCILGGTYIGTRGGSNENVAITSSDCETYILSNWNINIFTSPTEMNLKFFDNGDNTLTIPQQEEENLDPDFATIKGSGVVDPITRKIIMTIILVDFKDQPEVSLKLNPN